ncbi:MAG TPA: nucleotidyl transferase AbiEii/AbiGii toxin family protein [Bacillota bacterium]|nr:nucleotidyl transferase AbiEii/AbiGii toxin family protein [Bacillota bacterium]
MNTATQLKALIRNLSKEKNINAQILLRNYMFERLLERISLSNYRHSFILKGGMLIAAMVGLDTRSTMDMDATIKGIPVTHESIRLMFDEICSISINDSVEMSVREIEDIHDEAEYAGLRVTLDIYFDRVNQTLKVDITTGDKITPKEISYSFKLMLEPRSIEVLAYNLETVIAEKMETIISRSTVNTRMRDFYDIYILSEVQAENINIGLLSDAIIATTNRRGTTDLLTRADIILFNIEDSNIMQNLWIRYQEKYDYAVGVSWQDVMSAIKDMFNSIGL